MRRIKLLPIALIVGLTLTVLALGACSAKRTPVTTTGTTAVSPPATTTTAGTTTPSSPAATTGTNTTTTPATSTTKGTAPTSSPTTTTTVTTPTSAPTTTTTTTTSTATGSSQSVIIDITAQNLAFNISEIRVPAGAAVTINFRNSDSGIPHNVAVYENLAGGQTKIIFIGDTITSPATITYNFTAPAAGGNYFFRCDVHPFTMRGTFLVTP